MAFQSSGRAGGAIALATVAVLGLSIRAGHAEGEGVYAEPQSLGGSAQAPAPLGTSTPYGAPGSALGGAGGMDAGTPGGPPSAPGSGAGGLAAPGAGDFGAGGFGAGAGAASGTGAAAGFGAGSGAGAGDGGFASGGGGGGFDPGFSGGQFAALGNGTLPIAENTGYIDSAIIRSRFRIRYDAGYGFNSPDKAEFFYPKCGCFGNPANFLTPDGRYVPSYAFAHGYDPRATGPRVPGENHVDFQEIRPYLEVAMNRTTSVFIETPARFIDPHKNANAFGWSDMNLGFKHALIANPDQFYTLQFRTYVPTGVGQRGLGTNHATLEPGFLVFQRLTERLYFNGEVRDWIPVHASDFAGNVLIYGAGLTYNVVLTENLRVAPVTEFVGWSILSGKQSDAESPTGVSSAAGQTIVNAKIGLRVGIGEYLNPGGGSALNDRHSFYAGYGRVLTGDHWYSDMLRLEYNFLF